jgi:hypothetical protein
MDQLLKRDRVGPFFNEHGTVTSRILIAACPRSS